MSEKKYMNFRSSFGHINGHFKCPFFFLNTKTDILVQKTDIKNVRSGHTSWKVQINSKYANPDIRADIRGPKTDIKMSGCGHSECPDLLGTAEFRCQGGVFNP